MARDIIDSMRATWGRTPMDREARLQWEHLLAEAFVSFLLAYMFLPLYFTVQHAEWIPAWRTLDLLLALPMGLAVFVYLQHKIDRGKRTDAFPVGARANPTAAFAALAYAAGYVLGDWVAGTIAEAISSRKTAGVTLIVSFCCGMAGVAVGVWWSRLVKPR